MVFDFFKSKSESTFDVIEEQLQTMLSDTAHTFQLASNALFGRVDAAAVGDELRKSDRQVNRGERSIRRELIVHAGVAGPADYPLLLVYMSIIKDIERVGDYSKNIWDLARDGFVLDGAPDGPRWVERMNRTHDLIGQVASIFAERDGDRAVEVLPNLDVAQDEYDAEISELTRQSPTAQGAVPRALLNRYLKRITAHLMNVLTAVVMPLDRLDYWDEDKVDRS